MHALPLLLALTPLALSAETATPQFRHDLPNVSGKQLVSVVVDYAPGAKSQPHRHAASAFIYAYVLSGEIRSQLEGEPAPKVFHAGESWYENPGAHHVVSENASATKPAKLLAVFVVDTNATLTLPDTQ